MKKNKSALFARVTGTAMVYSMVVVITCLNRLFEMGADWKVSNLYFLQLAAMIIGLEIVDAMMMRLISKFKVFLVVNFVAILALTFGAGLLFGWYALTIDGLASVAIITLIVYSLVYWFLVSKHKADAAKINEKLEELNKDKPEAAQ